MGAWLAKVNNNFKMKWKELTTKQSLLLLIAVKVIGVAFATLVFARFSPLIDSELYIKGFYFQDQFFRTRAIQWIASVPNKIGGAYFAHLTFALISVLGLFYYFVTGGRRWTLVLTLLLPSTLVWTSIVGKEAIFVGGMGLSLVVWSKYTVRPLDRLDVVVAALAFGVCAVLRPHYAVAIAWIFVAVMLLKRWNKMAYPILAGLLIVGVLTFYLFVWENLLYRGYGAIEYTARASRYLELGILPNTSAGFEKFKSWMPLAVLVGIVGPFPSEVWRRIEFLPFFLEGVLILLSPVFIVFWVMRGKLQKRREFFQAFCWCLVPAILMLMVLHAPFGILNPGSATRWRTDFEQVFYLAPLLLMYRHMDDAHTKNHSLPP